MATRILAVFFLAHVMLCASAQGIHRIDFKNFDYPWSESLASPGSGWLETIPQTRLRLHHGEYRVPPETASAVAYLQLWSVTYGDLDGDRQDEAAVDLLCGSGGTANWHYLYVFKLSAGTVLPIGVLVSGSRAFWGLLGVQIRQGLLVLDFADADRRDGDCCSRGLVRVHYRFHDGRFVETGRRVKDSVRTGFYPLPKTGPQTVSTVLHGREVDIVYTDADFNTRQLTSSGVNTEPDLSSDKSSVVFLREPNDKEHEIWTVKTDGSALRRLYRGPFRWKHRSYPSSSIRSPQWSVDGRSVYFVTDFTLTTGALWRLEVEPRRVSVLIPDAVMYGVLQTGRYKGFLIANQLSPPGPASGEDEYPVYLYFLFTPRGEKVCQAGEELEDLESLLKEWEQR